MREEHQLARLFEEVRLAEPPMESTAADDLRRGRRHLRRRRVAIWSTAAAGVAAVASGVAFVLPSVGGGPAPDAELDFAGAAPRPVIEQPAEEPRFDALPFPVTTSLLLDIAAKHFDPTGVHLPYVVTNAGSGIELAGMVRVSSKLDWTIPGETGMGMVQVAVTTPGFAEGEYAEADIGWLVGCGDPSTCTEQAIPGTDQTVLVADRDPEQNLLLGVIHERPDGSFTAVGVYDLFGNNSLEPVSQVDITLEQAIAFVTDPDLRVDPAEAAEALEQLAAESIEADEGEFLPEFDDSEVVPAPAAAEMTAAEVQAALDWCTAGATEWEGFEPLFGLWVDAGGEPVSWVVAQRGEIKMLCEEDGAGLFGTPEVKDTTGMDDDVVPKVVAHFGEYSDAVSQVIIHRAGGDAPLEAVMRDGYWYLPADLRGSAQIAYRGYDGDGELIYENIFVR